MKNILVLTLSVMMFVMTSHDAMSDELEPELVRKMSYDCDQVDVFSRAVHKEVKYSVDVTMGDKAIVYGIRQGETKKIELEVLPASGDVNYYNPTAGANEWNYIFVIETDDLKGARIQTNVGPTGAKGNGQHSFKCKVRTDFLLRGAE